jgi:hypothetical protein
MDKLTVKQIAERFFEQQHSNIIVGKPVLEGNTWRVRVETGVPKMVKQVRIDANTGKILGFW